MQFLFILHTVAPTDLYPSPATHFKTFQVFPIIDYYYYYYYYYYRYSALGPVWAETRAQSGDWYGSGTLHSGQVLRGSLPLLSPDYKLQGIDYKA